MEHRRAPGSLIGIVRQNRLRTSWFVLGTVFGLTLSMLLQWFGQPDDMRLADRGYGPWQEESLQSRFDGEFDSHGEVAAQEIVNPTEADEDTASLTSEATEAEPESEILATGEKKRSVMMRQGDTLSVLLGREGVDSAVSAAIFESMRPVYKPSRLRAGMKLSMLFDAADATRLKELRIPVSVREELVIEEESEKRYRTSMREVPLVTRQNYSQATINSSLYEAADQAGIPSSVMGNMVEAYSYDVDFQREIKQGDRFEVYYESEHHPNGKHAGTGNLLFANLVLRGNDNPIYFFKSADGNTGFYTPDGSSLRKALLKTPIPGARMSSGFGMRRHPILGYSKMHRGIDFAAGTGTPIYAAGDGKVAYAGRRGGYGNYVQLKHNSTYSTAYAHMSRFARGIRSGKWVKQGTIIGYVGTTGRSTGPHLHYEIMKYGKQINPKNVKFSSGPKLAGNDLTRFKKKVDQIQTKLAEFRKDPTKLAMKP